ncbi:MFS general substrate transporter [Myriangium duriaei CBS 260.36]|uniref:MFS general substrate transporter n=1 Tax=Myriangium duriaei CBS 260.36 TaxID=1168546 RepID=A0A9P4MLD2_9PEZI|nr:MFS general substrate transporter [Myriangium duriaei CBS 260.36]
MAWPKFKRQSLRTLDSTRTNAAELTFRQSLFPLILVTTLFFLWGFSYGLLDTLNKHFQATLHINRARSSGLQAAYFGAYPLASLGHANWILRNFGYKPVFIWGLSLYAIGALVAWPCLLHQSFGGFCAAIFIIGNGLGSLETAANPYITVCGPPKYSELRINFSQAFNAIGTVVAPVLGSYVIFLKTGQDAQALRNVQWIYLAIACFCILLAVIFYFSPIPEITDADMAFQADETRAGTGNLPFRKQYRLFHASAAQFCYTGAQVAIAGYFINYVTETRTNTDNALGAKFLAGAQGAFAMGRFVGTLIMRFVLPRRVFLFYIAACIILIAPAIVHYGNAGLALLYCVLFFESICFPTIVALGMRGLGRHSKRGSGFIVAGVAGGAVVPPILGAAADSYGNTGRAMIVPLCFFLVTLSYALCVNFVPGYRVIVDSFHHTQVGVEDVGHDEKADERPAEEVEDIRTGAEKV